MTTMMLWVSCAFFASVASANTVSLNIPDDPCTGSRLGFKLQEPAYESFTVLGSSQVNLYQGLPVQQFVKQQYPLILILDGNGFSALDYDDMAKFLSAQGYHVAVINRVNGGPAPVNYGLAAIDLAVDYFNLGNDIPIGMMGHSVGGKVAIDIVHENAASRNPYEISALVMLAPNVVDDGTTTLLGENDLEGLMVIYGSQDNDVSGLHNTLKDGFAAYDRSGTESSTTCHGNGVCTNLPGMHKTMVYIHGADHAGLVNAPPECPIEGCPPFVTYVSMSNQFCIAKTYSLALFDYFLKEDTTWRRVLTGEYKTPTINNMVSSQADEIGNGPGTPIRLGIQVSPSQRSVIENFEGGAYILSYTHGQVQDQIIEPAGYFAGVHGPNVRHVTNYAALGWPVDNTELYQFVAFPVPPGKEDVSDFSHISIRMGQMGNIGDAATQTTQNTMLQVYVGLYDGSSVSMEPWDIMPYDMRPNGQIQSAMSTAFIRLTHFTSDKTNIEDIFLVFSKGTKGTIMVDNIEFVRGM